MGRAIGILAHVDAGKTTLSEAILLAVGAIRRAGRVDQGTAALDADPGHYGVHRPVGFFL